MTPKMEELLALLERLGYSGTWWAPPGSDLQTSGRVYLRVRRRDAKVALQFDNPASLEGVRLSVTIDPCGQPSTWYAGQRAKLREHFALALAAALALGDDAAVGDPAEEQQRARAAVAAALAQEATR